MKITVVVPSLRGGGAERVTSLLANAWSQNGHEVCVATFAREEHDAYGLDRAVRRVAFDLEGHSSGAMDAAAANAKRIRALRRLFRSSRTEVVLGMMATCSILSTIAAAGLRVPIVASERIYPPALPLGRAWTMLRRHVYPRAAVVVAQTEMGARWLADNCPGTETAVIANPVTWPLPPGEESLPRILPPQDRPYLLAVGRLERQKGFDILIEAFGGIAAAHPEWDLVIVGEGSQRRALEEAARSSGLQGRILLPGHLGNVQDWYGRAGLFVMSSRFEGFPNVLAEAMAHGCPAVSFDCPSGPAELIEHDVNGILVPVESGSRGLADAIDKMLAAPAHRSRMASRAQDVRERFALPVVARQWEQLFAGLVRSERKRADAAGKSQANI